MHTLIQNQYIKLNSMHYLYRGGKSIILHFKCFHQFKDSKSFLYLHTMLPVVYVTDISTYLSKSTTQILKKGINSTENTHFGESKSKQTTTVFDYFCIKHTTILASMHVHIAYNLKCARSFARNYTMFFFL